MPTRRIELPAEETEEELRVALFVPRFARPGRWPVGLEAILRRLRAMSAEERRSALSAMPEETRKELLKYLKQEAGGSRLRQLLSHLPELLDSASEQKRAELMQGIRMLEAVTAQVLAAPDMAAVVKILRELTPQQRHAIVESYPKKQAARDGDRFDATDDPPAHRSQHGALNEAQVAVRKRLPPQGAARAAVPAMSKLLESNGWVGLHPMAFMCIPIRSAVFLGGLGCALQGFLLLQHADLISVRRLFVGGYNDWSCALMDLLDVSAGVWGLIGALGAFYMREGFLRTFYYYEALRLMCWFLMYFLDVPLLLNCELGRDDPNAFVERFGAHQAVLKIAAEGQCDEDRKPRSFFYVLSFACLAFFSQFFFATQRLLLDFSDDPRYLLLSKEGPTGIFQQQVGSGVPTAATPLVFSGVNAPEGSPRPLENLA
eukprot:g22531.t1